MSAQKMREVVRQIQGMNALQAVAVLGAVPRKSARVVAKTLKSAIANAEHNDSLDIDELFIEHVSVDEGPTMKRWRARARGRTAKILKRTSHVTIKVKELGQ